MNIKDVCWRAGFRGGKIHYTRGVVELVRGSRMVIVGNEAHFLHDFHDTKEEAKTQLLWFFENEAERKRSLWEEAKDLLETVRNAEDAEVSE